MVFAYGLSGLVYGYLHVFVLEGFALLSGAPAMMVSLGSAALGFGWATHLWQRHWPSASQTACRDARRLAYWTWGLLWAAGFLIDLLSALAPGQEAAGFGIAPDADWFLAPLPWMWPQFVGFAANSVVIRLLLIASCGFLLGALCAKLGGNKAGMVLMGVAISAFGAFCLGDASYQYAAARKLQGLVHSELAASLLANPGRYNGWTFICWWGGWAFVAMGTLAVAAGLFVPTQVLRQGQPD